MCRTEEVGQFERSPAEDIPLPMQGLPSDGLLSTLVRTFDVQDTTLTRLSELLKDQPRQFRSCRTASEIVSGLASCAAVSPRSRRLLETACPRGG